MEETSNLCMVIKDDEMGQNKRRMAEGVYGDHSAVFGVRALFFYTHFDLPSISILLINLQEFLINLPTSLLVFTDMFAKRKGGGVTRNTHPSWTP